MSRHDLDEYPYQEVPSDAPFSAPETRPHGGLAVIIAVLIVSAAIAAYIVFLAPASTPIAPTPTATSNAGKPAPARPLGGSAPSVVLPPLDQTDSIVRRMVRDVSGNGVVNSWLMGSDLIRNFVAAAVNIEEGATPAKLLGRLRPTATFRIAERGGREYVDPRSYERYDAAADAIAALDPSRVARLYTTLKPRIEDAYHDLGFAGHSFDRTLQAVIVALVRTPIPDERAVLRRKEARYLYADEAFENLTSAQKQFLRMGPRNVRRVDQWLRRLADALGIPAAAFSLP